MKRIMTLLLAAGLVFGAATGAKAIDFNIQGEWLMGLGAVNSTFVTKQNGNRTGASADDKFQAMQRLRLQMEAVASESLSGTVAFEIGDTLWGSANGLDGGGALGADGKIVELRRAYLDWTVPTTSLRFRMGIQGVALPNTAGGSSILDQEAAGITASYKFNDNVSLTGVWVRPYNDNYANTTKSRNNPANYLDNVDLFVLSLPLTMDGWTATPWAMLGFAGKNYYKGDENEEHLRGGDVFVNTMPYEVASGNAGNENFNKNAYSNIFFFGLPITISAFDPFNIEVDLNYGYSDGLGRYDAYNYRNGTTKRGDSKREGWLIKALVEYKMDWGTPGILGWYASGDDGNVKNGSERMPAISPSGNFTSFIGDDPNMGWSLRSGDNLGYDLQLSYAGTWGLGVQLKDVSFLEDLKHTFRAVYWGGTNSPSMIKYLGATDAGVSTVNYLTTNDSMLEFNLDSEYKIYENLDMIVQLGYIVNGIDKGTWNRYYRDGSFQKGDGYKAAAIFKYSF